jgi:acetyltransferase-like isoleucine patch superfamily enzyme
MAGNVSIKDTVHKFDNIDAKIPSQSIMAPHIEIGNYVWIVYSAVIAKGVKIGKSFVIGASRVATECIEQYVGATESPAQVVKEYENK